MTTQNVMDENDAKAMPSLPSASVLGESLIRSKALDSKDQKTYNKALKEFERVFSWETNNFLEFDMNVKASNLFNVPSISCVKILQESVSVTFLDALRSLTMNEICVVDCGDGCGTVYINAMHNGVLGDSVLEIPINRRMPCNLQFVFELTNIMFSNGNLTQRASPQLVVVEVMARVVRGCFVESEDCAFTVVSLGFATVVQSQDTISKELEISHRSSPSEPFKLNVSNLLSSHIVITPPSSVWTFSKNDEGISSNCMK
jgi:hypothetical protein